MLFQIGAAHPSPVISLNRIERSLHLKPSAFQVILPDWVVAGQEEQIVFLQKIAAYSESIPLVLYNPPHAKSVLLPHEFEILQIAVPSLIGIKVASGNRDWFNQMRMHTSNISVFVPGHFLATGVQEGVASGAYSNVACISPRGCATMVGVDAIRFTCCIGNTGKDFEIF
jgi:dihydrodipicolinate synthase/N-acetylneuraminate lyase